MKFLHLGLTLSVALFNVFASAVAQEDEALDDISFESMESNVYEESQAPIDDFPVDVKKRARIDNELSYPFLENLLIKPLPNNHLMLSFDFNLISEEFTPSKSAYAYDEYSHYTVFPKAISPLLHQTSTRQLHLRFTRGYWDAESWASLPHDGFKAGGSGVELWAVIEAASREEAYEKWKSLANSLGGLFCASINFIDSTKTTFPVSSFHPEEKEGGLPLFAEGNQLYLIRAALANEPVCTENLTPLIKLFPTKGKSGISAYLDGHKVFNTLWHSMSIDVVTLCDEGSNQCHYDMEANVDMVVHVPSTLARNDRPIPKPVSIDELACDQSKVIDAFRCFPAPQTTVSDFSLSQIFGKTIPGSGKFSSHPSTICVDVTDKWDVMIEADKKFFSTNNNCFELESADEYDLHISSKDTRDIKDLNEIPLYVSRSLTGYAQDRGGLRSVFTNPGPTPVSLVYFESLPWFMRIYLSSLIVENQTGSQAPQLELDEIISNIHYIPAVDRKRPTHLELSMTIPANTTITLSYQFDKALLHFSEYPPDANHGFEIESAVVTIIEPTPYQIRTASLLLYLSTPDFSMPYNVIIITSTIMGLIFGMVFNLMVKKLVTLEEADKIMAKRGLKYKLLLLKQNFKSKLGQKC